MEKKHWKSTELKILESEIQKKWKENLHYYDTNLSNPNKFMATFPYPYMNGDLHLGHGFTLSKYEFICMFYRSMNYDVLQPFSFHLTGMPIMSASDKLKNDLSLLESGIELPETSQYMIMKKMGIDDSEIKKFVDPLYWGIYFPDRAKKTLERFGIHYDARRSFITTDANPIYDSFVKWQFTHLYTKGLLKFGTRYDLYSVKDAQPCLGHERASGEDAIPKIKYLIRFDITPDIKTDPDIKFIHVLTNLNDLIEQQSIVLDNNPYSLFVVETSNGTEKWITQEYKLISLIHQTRITDTFYIKSYNNIKNMTSDELLCLNVINPYNSKLLDLKLNNKAVKSDKHSHEYSEDRPIEITGSIKYYEPDKDAYSRSGDKLIVAKMDQWFIDYGNAEWKELAKKHVETMKLSDPIVKNLLNIAIDWLDQWPCSRTYGLGSHFPDIVEKDTKQIIDSLSDSTIYMALYTIYHLFDIYKIDASELTNDVWDYIFLFKHHDNEIYDKFKPFRDEFFHWYPMDVRISAKDLIPNHLSMSIFHHVAIWDKEFMSHYGSFGPRSYEINGYISIKTSKTDIEKMSKSKGNFKTLDQAIDLYTADAIRFTFASASTGTDDSYFDQDLCTRMVEKLYKEKEWIIDIESRLREYSKRDLNFIDMVFINEIFILCKDVIDAYKKMNFFEVVTKGFHIFQGLRDEYQLLLDRDMNQSIIHGFITLQLTLMKPIIPHFCDYFNMSIKMCDIDTWIMVNFNTFDIDMVKHWQYKYLKKISEDINFRIFQTHKKYPVKSVKILVTKIFNDPMGTKIFNDPIESLAYDIYMTNKHLSAKEVIATAKSIDSKIMEDSKNNGLINICYKNFKHIFEEYGEKVFNILVESSNFEYQTLKDNLHNYLKKTSIGTYTLEIEISDNRNIKISEPLILYNF